MKYFFDRKDQDKPPTTPAQHAPAERMIDDWTTFAHTGQPGPHWPTEGAWAHSYSSADPTVDDLAATHRFPFWDALRTRAADR